MTTPIKFRGFRTDNNEPVYGSLVQFTESILSIFVLKNGGHDVFQIHPSSLGMFTGRTDKNGREIYGAIGEKGGDAISFGKDLSYIVKFNDGAFEVYHTKYNPLLRWGLLSRVWELMWQESIEIIGNQWEVDNGK